MKKIYVGYVQGVHGLRGDLKIRNKFSTPEKVFKVGMTIYLNSEPHKITACKLYKNCYLCTIDNIKDINQVEKYIGYDVHVDREELSLTDGEYLLEDLFDMTIECNNKYYGKVKEITNNGIYNILVIDYGKSYMIPLISEFVINVDINDKKIVCKDIERLMV